MIIVSIMLTILFIYLIRAIISLLVNRFLFKKSTDLLSEGNTSEYKKLNYMDWEILTFILRDLHLWTPQQVYNNRVRKGKRDA